MECGVVTRALLSSTRWAEIAAKAVCENSASGRKQKMIKGIISSPHCRAGQAQD